MGNTIRFTGMASGLDTESLVKAMLTSHQTKIDTAKQAQTKIEWKQEAWKDMNKKINSFYTNYIDKLRLGSTFGASKVVNSNTSALDINTNGTLPQGTHKIEISQLATNAYAKNEAMSNATVKPLSSETTLRELGVTSTTTIDIKAIKDNKVVTEEGATVPSIEIAADDTLETVMKKFGDVGIDMQITDGKIVLKNTVPGESGEGVKLEGASTLLSKLGVSSTTILEDKTVTGKAMDTLTKETTLGRLGEGISSGTITINGKEISLSADMTLSALEKKIKEADSNLNVNLDLTQKRFFITGKETGEDSKIEIESDENILKQLGLSGTVVQGQNAKYKYNDQEFESSSNVVSINGLEMTFKEVTDKPITLSVTKNAEKVTEFVKEFVSEYNSLIEEINSLLDETPSRTYGPLTDAQKEEMSESEITAWEKKAKQGLFYRDSQLTAVKDSLRNILGSAVPGSQYGTLSSVGITTGNWKEKGKLNFDEDKFAKALEENPDDVLKLFTGGEDAESAAKLYAQKNPGKTTADFNNLKDTEKASYLSASKGIFNRLQSDFDKMLKSSKVKSYGSFYNDKLLSSQLTQAKDKINRYQDRYDSAEELYYAKFTAMEKILSQLNSQSSIFSS